jgi:S1-C subfamily serine protease
MSRIASFIAGAVSVGAVVGVLALSGALDDNGGSTTSTAPAPTATAATQPTATTPVATPAPPGSVAGIYDRVSKGVVFVESDRGGTPAASGSGFVIDAQGHIVTNEHVVAAGSSYKVRFGTNGDPVPARLLGADKSNDLAVLQVDAAKAGSALQPLQLGSSQDLKPGETTIAIGSPFGLEGTVTTGIVSGLNRTIQAPNGFSISGAIQTDAAINPGNSGGPLLDGQGRVIGVNSQIASQSGSNSGVGFAVPVDQVKRVVAARLPRRLHGGGSGRRRAGRLGGRRRPGREGRHPPGRPDRADRRPADPQPRRPRRHRQRPQAGREDRCDVRARRPTAYPDGDAGHAARPAVPELGR